MFDIRTSTDRFRLFSLNSHIPLEAFLNQSSHFLNTPRNWNVGLRWNLNNWATHFCALICQLLVVHQKARLTSRTIAQ